MSSPQRVTSCSLSLRTRWIVFSYVCYHVVRFVSPLHFDISSSDMLYEGVAVPAEGSADLTPKGTIPQEFQVGRVQYSKPVDIWDSISRRQADFSTRFSFTIEPFDPDKYSDGIAFFLAPAGFTIPPNSGGGYLGLFNASTLNDGPGNHIVMVEFDTYENMQAYHDSPGQHIGINENSLSSLVYSSWDPGSLNGSTTNVVVTYNSTSKNLSVFWSFGGEPVSLDNKNSSLSQTIDLAEVLPESVAIGISASHGLCGERHRIHSWEFTSNLDVARPPPGYTSAKAVNSKIHRLLVLITTALASLLLIISAGSCLFVIKMRKKYELCARTDIDKEIRALPLKFSYQELVVATSGFSQDRRLGQGGSCHVYKGLVNSLDRQVAVKRIFTDSKHSQKVFINEVKILSRAIHRNLVQFIGWCREEGEFLLVYEYMPNGSLDNHLFGSRKVLPWDVRHRIALGLASALNYLHEELEQCVLHRDIKAANILLDTDFNTKLGDFGVSKLVDPRFRTQTTDVVGTYGYLAPEYLSGRKATRESDMFSFGVVVLEIACGRRTYQDGEFHVPLYKWVWQLYVAGNVLEAADEKFGSSFDRKEMECLMMVGLWCVHPDPKSRPKAGQVIRFLQLQVTVPELPLAAYEAPTLYQPPALTIASSSSSSSGSQGIVVLSEMDHGS
ncbi:L-type lectin-domain containing receptor kinase IX.1-like [Rhodamnia argentea]|uniref:L-type lectin-domain containing receptor kinase IX.1-like n=1 Tax=Rhodamnia argentea TaxID=178133 RepID=A0A8B8NZV7_9MYRT|nr:L-type lectin-domain containing receptor kinase IX.1-like [Rhodamnia argentea]